MTNNVAPSVVLNTVATFWRLAEKAGMTLQHLQRVIDRPALRRAIVDLIEADMVKLWQPDSNPSYTPTNLDGWTEPFGRLFNGDSDADTASHKEQLDSLIKELEGKVSPREIAEKVFRKAGMRDPLSFLYYHGLIGDRPITIEELASGFDVSPQTIKRRINKCHYELTSSLWHLLGGEYKPLTLLKAGLVSHEWAASTDDLDVLDLSYYSRSVVWTARITVTAEFEGRGSSISQLAKFSEAQLAEALRYHILTTNHVDDTIDVINEIKTALAKFGLSLAES